MSNKDKELAPRILVSLFAEDYEFLSEHYKLEPGLDRIGISPTIRLIVHRYIQGLRTAAQRSEHGRT